MSTAAAAPTTRGVEARFALLEGISAPWLLLLGTLVVIARRPESLLRAEFNWEEANAFYVPTYFFSPIDLLVEPWGGTLQVVPRLGYAALRTLPTVWAPLGENVLAMASLLAVAAFIASSRLRSAVPSRSLRLLFAALLLVLPAQWAVMGSFVNVQWYGALWLALLPVAAVPRSRTGAWAERGGVALVGLTGPFSTLFAPAYIWRAWRERTRHAGWLAAIVTITGAVQLLTAVLAGRADASGDRSVVFGATTLLLHAGIIPVIGERLTEVLGVVAIPTSLLFAGAVALVVSVLAVGVRVVPARLSPFVYCALVVAVSGIAVHRGNGIWPPGANERYFLILALFVAAVIATAAARRMPLGIALALLLTVGIVVDFRLEPFPPQGWDRSHACIGGAEACTVPVWPHDYDVRWPGSGGTYELPVHHDP